jgi:hypothetical protein
MPCPQFTLRALLVWVTLLPAAFGALVAAFGTDGSMALPLLLLAGAMFGTCVAVWKDWRHAALGAYLGMMAIVPLALLLGCFLFLLDSLRHE